jgi:hypothetical protein
MGSGGSKLPGAFRRQRRVTVMGQTIRCSDYCPAGVGSNLVSLRGVGAVDLSPSTDPSRELHSPRSISTRSVPGKRPLDRQIFTGRRWLGKSGAVAPQPAPQPANMRELRLREDKGPVCVLVCEDIDDATSPPKGLSWAAD